MRFKNKNEKGFTLIELLVGTIIVVISATAVVILISSSFRISNQTTNSGTVTESGNNAVNFLERTIQFAYGFYGVSNDPSFSSYQKDCTTTASYTNVRIITSSGTTQQFSCSGGHLYFNNGSGNADLIDTNKITISTCQFSCSQTNVNTPPVIEINLKLSLKNGSSLPEQNASIDFTTSAKMRNL